MASHNRSQRKQQSQNQNQKAQSSFSVDPLSDLVSASELRLWRNDLTTQKIMRYLERWRAQLLESLGEGDSIEPMAEATAARTTEFVAKNQLLKDLIGLEAKDIAQFYNLSEPRDK